MHDVLRSIAVLLLVSALGVVRWVKRGSRGTAIGSGGIMLVLAALAFELRDLAPPRGPVAPSQGYLLKPGACLPPPVTMATKATSTTAAITLAVLRPLTRCTSICAMS